MASQAARGKAALDAKDYETAVAEYTAAIKESPTSPDYFIQRSTAHTRMKKYPEALDDAEQAVINAQKRSKKEAIIEAQFRRGVALHQLQRYADALFILELVKAQQSDHKQVAMYISMTSKQLEKLPEDDEKRKRTVEVIPLPKAANVVPINDGKAPSSAARGGSTSNTSKSAPTAVLQQTPVEKIRHEFYQNTENVYLTLFAKGVPKDKAEIEIKSHSLSISFPTSGDSIYSLDIDPLFAPVVPERCITRIMPSKVEIILIKATPDQKWASLEGKEATKPDSAIGHSDFDNATTKTTAREKPVATAPVYPTSSKSGPKDWDKITKDLRTSDKTDGKASAEDDDDIEGDEANHFFKKLFKGATPEMQRAMMKSYTESNGTALSTNWDEVSKGPVETSPPDGMEATKW